MRVPLLCVGLVPSRRGVRLARALAEAQAQHRRGAEPDHDRRVGGRSRLDGVDGTSCRHSGDPRMSSVPTLSVHGLRVSVDGKEILKGVDLEVPQGEVHALMGPNGSGKSTLAYALMGHPKYQVTAGGASFAGEDLIALPADARAKLGLFLCFQYPTAIPGVTTVNFL